MLKPVNWFGLQNNWLVSISSECYRIAIPSRLSLHFKRIWDSDSVDRSPYSNVREDTRYTTPFQRWFDVLRHRTTSYVYEQHLYDAHDVIWTSYLYLISIVWSLGSIMLIIVKHKNSSKKLPFLNKHKNRLLLFFFRLILTYALL